MPTLIAFCVINFKFDVRHFVWKKFATCLYRLNELTLRAREGNVDNRNELSCTHLEAF